MSRNQPQIQEQSQLLSNRSLQIVETDKSLLSDAWGLPKDQLKELEKEFKSKFLQSLFEQLEKKIDMLKNQTNILKKQKELCEIYGYS